MSPSNGPPLPPVDYAFRSSVDGAQPWHVRNIYVVEELSGTFMARIELECDDPAADPAALLGASATLTLSRPTFPPLVRRWSGIVRGTEEPAVVGVMERRHGVVVLEPAFACLKEEVLTRKFQETTVPDVLRAVLKDVQGAFERESELRLVREKDGTEADTSYAVRDLCVQYGETTHGFLRRLMSEEGLSYYFEQGEQAEKLVVVDDNVSFPETIGAIQLLPPGSKLQTEEAVHGFGVTRGRGPRRAEVRAFEPTQHRALMAERRREDGPGAGNRGDAELYQAGTQVMPFGFKDDVYKQTDIRVQAGLELERALARSVEGRGNGGVIGFAPGHVFTLATETLGLPHGGGRYLITGVQHHGENPARFATAGHAAADYENSFTCVPAEVPFRPPLLPKPSAIEDWGLVVSAFPGDPIYTEKHGRVRVRFGYDREENQAADRCSPWIPVLQGWAGNGYGLQIIPRAGMLVRLRYLFGDPDRPFVAGCLPTGANVLPSALPMHKSRLTLRTRSLRAGGDDREHFNEITLDDAAEREELFIHAGRDYHRKVLHDERTEIDHDESRAVGNDQTLEVKGQRTKTVHKDETITIKQKRTTTVQGDNTRTVHGNDTQTVEKEQVVTVHGPRTTTVDKHEKGIFFDGRDEDVKGDDRLHVSQQHLVIADQEWLAQQGPTSFSLKEGHARLNAGGDITLHVEGAEFRIQKGGKAVLECDTKVQIVCGSSSIVMTPDKIEIAAPEVLLTGDNGAVKLDRSGATTTGLNVTSTATVKNELTGAFVKAN
jgi:type VI secretion system secreted protein VgrG